MRRLQLAVTALLFLAGCTGAPAGAAAAKATVNITPTLVAVAAPSPTAPPPSVTPRSDASPTPQPQAPATPTTGITVPLASEGTPAVNDVIRIESIRSAYNILMDKYYKSLKSNDLLKAAWIGVVDRATSAKPAGALATPAFTGDRIADFKLFQDRYAALVGSNTSYDPVQLSFGAIEGMTSSLGDDHTAFLSPEINARFQQESSGGSQTVGLGVSLGGRNPPFVIQDVVPGGPADKAGVKPGDTIVAIDGQDVSKQDLQHIAGLLRGTAGTNVKLGLQRPGAANVEITVTRGPFVTPVLSSKILPNGVGYIRLRQFPQTYAKFPDGNTFEQELDAELAAFEKAGVTVWVVDLRNNPGGSVAALAQITGRFLPDGLVVVSVDRQGVHEENLVDGHLFTPQRPLAVLVNGNSASSSELFSAAIQENKRGIVVGQQTAGAVNAAEEFPLPDGAAMQVTVAEARTGKAGKVLDGNGVKPDVEVKDAILSADDLAKGRDPQLDRAVALLQADAAKQPTLNLTPLPHPAWQPAQIMATLGPVLAPESVIPAGPDRHLAGIQVIDTLNEYVSGAEDAAALKTKVLARGWLGTIQMFFGSHDPPTYFVGFDIYKDEAGAKEATLTNDFPNQFQEVPPPVKLGDDTTAYKGIGSAVGSTAITWRRGRVVIGVQQFGEPGKETFDQIVQIAQALDADYAKHPIP